MQNECLISFLGKVDSTNNYATAAIHAGLAKHGMAWVAEEQMAGRGQRGKQWVSKPGENLLMTILFQPPTSFTAFPFLLSASVALSINSFLADLGLHNLKLKWPNDIYIYDNKAGGILIENNYKGNDWQWAIVGFGLNVNQRIFDGSIPNPTSLKVETGNIYDVQKLAAQIHEQILNSIDKYAAQTPEAIMEAYNNVLYKKNEIVKLRRDNRVFEAEILGVNNNGQLHIAGAMDEWLDFGSVEMVR